MKRYTVKAPTRRQRHQSLGLTTYDEADFDTLRGAKSYAEKHLEYASAKDVTVIDQLVGVKFTYDRISQYEEDLKS